MRIGLITPGFSASENDWCVPALSDLARVLAERDEVTVFSLRYPHLRTPYSVHGATVLPTGGAQRRGLARLPILARTLARVVREAKRRPFDVLCAWWAHEPGFVAALAGRLTRTPVLVAVLGGELVDLPEIGYGGGRSRVNRWLTSRALAGAASVTVGSRFLKDLVRHRVPPEKLRLQPLGVELERFTDSASGLDSPRLDGDPRLLHVASLSPVKDQRMLLEAFEIVARRYPRARLHLVGEGVVEPELAARMREPGLKGRVDFHGAIDHGRLAGLYRQADLFIQSSRFESQGMVVLEAAACGCPVTGTAVGILPELCPSEAIGGAVSAPADSGSLAEAVLALLDDPARRRRLAKAQAAAVHRFELRATAAQWRQCFETLNTSSSNAEQRSH